MCGVVWCDMYRSPMHTEYANMYGSTYSHTHTQTHTNAPIHTGRPVVPGASSLRRHEHVLLIEQLPVVRRLRCTCSHIHQ